MRETKQKVFTRILATLFCAFCLAGCNDDESGFSASQVRQALFDLKGTYHGNVQVAYYHGSNITELTDAVAVSKDSLTFTMSLLPMANLIAEESVADVLRQIGEIKVTAEYDFQQMDGHTLNFVLHPEEVTILGGYGAPPSVRIVFAQTFGGDAETDKNFIMFNISPQELWINGTKHEDFKQLVYHFRGTYE